MIQHTQDTAPSILDVKSVHAAIVQLASEASIEINVQDSSHLRDAPKFLPAGTRIFISHLSKQTWQATVDACKAVRAAGFDPVPHVPVRLLPSAESFDKLLGDFVTQARVQDLLLISGDYSQAEGPFSAVEDAIRTGLLNKHGIGNVSVAGHPEGHPNVAVEEIRRAESGKAALAQQLGLQLSLVTQFFFEHQPFLKWVDELRQKGVKARIVGGLAGPAGLTTLFKFAVRCGAGPSIRALGARPDRADRARLSGPARSAAAPAAPGPQPRPTSPVFICSVSAVS